MTGDVRYNMNFNVRKEAILVDLLRLEEEAKLLLERIPAWREDLLKVKTEEEALEFDKTHDLEEGLNIIRLF